MMPDRYHFREKAPPKSSSSGWVTQIAIVLLVAAGFLAWQSPTYWSQRVFHSAPAKASVR